MSVRDIFKGKQGGIRCESTPDGLGVQCEVYEKRGEEKVSTGTNFEIVADLENNCETSFQGSFDLSDGDEHRVKRISDQVKKACLKKKGFA